MKKVFTVMYLLVFALFTILSFVFMKISVTTIIIAAAFLVNFFLLLDVFREED